MAYVPPGHVKLFDAPCNVTRDYLESKLETDTAWYGMKDYILFALRPLFHLFGKSTVNAGGVICSEMVRQHLTGNLQTTRQF